MDMFDQELRLGIRKLRLAQMDTRKAMLDIRKETLQSKPETSWDEFDRLEGVSLVAQYTCLTNQAILMQEADSNA